MKNGNKMSHLTIYIVLIKFYILLKYMVCFIRYMLISIISILEKKDFQNILIQIWSIVLVLFFVYLFFAVVQHTGSIEKKYDLSNVEFYFLSSIFTKCMKLTPLNSLILTLTLNILTHDQYTFRISCVAHIATRSLAMF